MTSGPWTVICDSLAPCQDGTSVTVALPLFHLCLGSALQSVLLISEAISADSRSAVQSLANGSNCLLSTSEENSVLAVMILFKSVPVHQLLWLAL